MYYLTKISALNPLNLPTENEPACEIIFIVFINCIYSIVYVNFT